MSSAENLKILETPAEFNINDVVTIRAQNKRQSERTRSKAFKVTITKIESENGDRIVTVKYDEAVSSEPICRVCDKVLIGSYSYGFRWPRICSPAL